MSTCFLSAIVIRSRYELLALLCAVSCGTLSKIYITNNPSNCCCCCNIQCNLTGVEISVLHSLLIRMFLTGRVEAHRGELAISVADRKSIRGDLETRLDEILIRVVSIIRYHDGRKATEEGEQARKFVSRKETSSELRSSFVGWSTNSIQSTRCINSDDDNHNRSTNWKLTRPFSTHYYKHISIFVALYDNNNSLNHSQQASIVNNLHLCLSLQIEIIIIHFFPYIFPKWESPCFVCSRPLHIAPSQLNPTKLSTCNSADCIKHSPNDNYPATSLYYVVRRH